MRINKYLASCGIASRRKVEEYIKNGQVKVNGAVVTKLSTDINENDVILFNKKKIIPEIQYEYYMLNKPKGYVSTASDDRGRKVVTQLIKTNARIYPVGRLDYDSEGLLLLTNDGDLTNKLTHPKHQIDKTYNIKIDSEISNQQIDSLQKGVIIDGYKLSPCKITKKVERTDNIKEKSNFKQTNLQIIIHEGRNREIRKMFETIGKKVVFLKRVKIAELSLGSLKRGEYRKLTIKEVEYLKNL